MIYIFQLFVSLALHFGIVWKSIGMPDFGKITPSLLDLFQGSPVL